MKQTPKRVINYLAHSTWEPSLFSNCHYVLNYSINRSVPFSYKESILVIIRYVVICCVQLNCSLYFEEYIIDEKWKFHQDSSNVPN
jgi:hypothetical protein